MQSDLRILRLTMKYCIALLWCLINCRLTLFVRRRSPLPRRRQSTFVKKAYQQEFWQRRARLHCTMQFQRLVLRQCMMTESHDGEEDQPPGERLHTSAAMSSGFPSSASSISLTAVALSRTSPSHLLCVEINAAHFEASIYECLQTTPRDAIALRLTRGESPDLGRIKGLEPVFPHAILTPLQRKQPESPGSKEMMVRGIVGCLETDSTSFLIVWTRAKDRICASGT